MTEATSSDITGTADHLSPTEAHARLVEMLRPVDPDAPIQRWYRRRGKRLVDVVVAGLGLVMVAPVAALVALAVRVRMGPSVLFVQERVGAGESTFGIYKFRTMHHDRRRATGRDSTSSFDGPERRDPVPSLHDPRLTRLGRWLSRASLDELPQLVNVVRGDMSIVGPRPDYPHRIGAYSPDERRRFSVRPGLTGPWQVLVGTSADLSEFAALDLVYIDRCSPGNDVRLALATPGAMIRRFAHAR